MDPQQLASAYDRGTFGVSRRAFLKLAAVTGVSAAAGMLVFPEQQAAAAFTQPAAPNWPPLSGDKIRFTVHSDTHVGASPNNNYRDKIPEAFSAIYAMAPDVDAHFFVGDSADTGHPDQYVELAQLLNANARKPVGIVMGNHEYYNWSGSKQNAQDAFKTFLASELNVAGSFQIPGGANEGQVDADFTVGGYHVLAVAPEPGGYDNSWYGAKRDWILEHCAAAAAEDPAKPIFLLTHHPFPNTVWYSGSNSWDGQFDENANTAQSGAFYQELCEKYENISKPVHWHMIGHLQTNKVKYIIDKVELIHSVDSFHLAKQIEKEEKGKAYKLSGDVSGISHAEMKCYQTYIRSWKDYIGWAEKLEI